MKKNKKYLVIGIAAIITILILWYIFKKGNISNTIIVTKPPAGGKGSTQPASNTSGSGLATSTGFPIKWMVYCGAFKALQSALGVTADGYFGNDTLAAWQPYNSAVDQNYTIDTPGDLAAEISAIQSAKNNGNTNNSSNNNGSSNSASPLWAPVVNNTSSDPLQQALTGNGAATDSTNSSPDDLPMPPLYTPPDPDDNS